FPKGVKPWHLILPKFGARPKLASRSPTLRRKQCNCTTNTKAAHPRPTTRTRRKSNGKQKQGFRSPTLRRKQRLCITNTEANLRGLLQQILNRRTKRLHRLLNHPGKPFR